MTDCDWFVWLWCIGTCIHGIHYVPTDTYVGAIQCITPDCTDKSDYDSFFYCEVKSCKTC